MTMTDNLIQPAPISAGLGLSKVPAMPTRHPQERPGECAAALLAEITPDYFPGLRLDDRNSMPSISELLENAALTLAHFAAALMDGSHGPGCPGRAEEDAADRTCDRGQEPYCTVCDEEIHILRGEAGWRHIRIPSAADNQDRFIQIIDPGHEPVLAWREWPSLAEPSPGR